MLSENAETGADRWTSQGWTYAKRALAFAELTNDGDLDGAFFLDRLPSPEEAEIVRRYIGIAKKAEFSEDALAQKREGMLKAREALGKKLASDDLAGLMPADGGEGEI